MTILDAPTAKCLAKELVIGLRGKEVDDQVALLLEVSDQELQKWIPEKTDGESFPAHYFPFLNVAPLSVYSPNQDERFQAICNLNDFSSDIDPLAVLSVISACTNSEFDLVRTRAWEMLDERCPRFVKLRAVGARCDTTGYAGE